MNVTLRTVTEQDADAITRLSEQLGYSATASATAQRIMVLLQHQDHCAFAAQVGTDLIGWIHGFYTFRLESDAFVEIGGLVVDERYRGKGIGKMLIERAKVWAREKAVNKVRVRCNINRTATHAFYRHIGFTESKEQKIFDLQL